MSILRTVLHKLIYICYSRDTISLSRSNNYMINILKEGFYEVKNKYKRDDICFNVISNGCICGK